MLYRRITWVGSALLAVFLATPVIASNDLPSFEALSLFQLRKNSISDRELPWLSRFRLDQRIPWAESRLSLDGQFLADPIQSGKAGDLFRASLSWAPTDSAWSAEAGRLLLNNSESVIALDGATVGWGRNREIGGRFFGGARRHLEVDDFKSESILLGGDLRIEPLSVTSISFGYRMENDLESVTRHWIVGGMRQALPVPFTPVFYGSVDYQADEKTLGSFLAGAEVHPFSRFQISGDISRFDEASDGYEWSNRVLLSFAKGPIWRQSFAVHSSPFKNSNVWASYARHSYDVLAGNERNGHLTRFGGDWRTGKRPLKLSGEASYQRSYGGKVFTFLTTAQKQITEGWHASLEIGNAWYDKITGSSDYAFHTGVAGYYTWPNGLQVGLNSEFNSNIDQPRDLRVGMMARYVYF